MLAARLVKVVVGVVAISALQLAVATPAFSVVSVDKHCVTTMKRIAPGQRSTVAVSQRCTFAPANKSASLREQREARASLLDLTLVVFYEDANYGGDSDEIEFDDGPCDTSGYGSPTWMASKMPWTASHPTNS